MHGYKKHNDPKSAFFIRSVANIRTMSGNRKCLLLTCFLPGDHPVSCLKLYFDERHKDEQ